MPLSWIVVPDGLAADDHGRPLPEPSFVYRAVLDWIAARVPPEDCIYLAPANRFGGGTTEQEAGRQYLEPITKAEIVAGPSRAPDYIDTRGNARLLRRELEAAGRWPLANAHLVSYTLHLPRALEVFVQEGFSVEQAHGVMLGDTVPSPIVGRLWYYRYPLIHRGYEAVAVALTKSGLI